MSEPPPEGRDQSVPERWSPGTPGDAGAPSAAVSERLLNAWREEIAASRLYEMIAQRTPAREAAILRRMAHAEAGHRRRLEARMRELGIGVPSPDTVRMSWWQRLQARIAPVDRLLASAEAAEDEAVDILYHHETGDSTTDALLSDLREEERSHSYAIRELRGQPPVTQQARPAPALAPEAELAPTLAQEAEGALPAKEKLEPQEKLDRVLGREKWHQTSGGWIGDVIYGANDGLAAVFGIVAGVSGATGGSSFVLTAGISGAIASALSMATGAFLAARSEAEVAAANVERERQEIELHPEEEQAELSLFYQLKGIDETTADAMAAQLAKQPDAMLRALAAEEFGYTGDHKDPAQSALAAGISTGLGAIVPVIPFFFTTGTVAILAAAAVSLIAHFLVGAAKSLVTLRKWWSAGLEMTLAGVIVGGATFLVGLALPT